MKNLKKKMIYLLGASTLILTPIYGIVSCGTSDKTPKKNIIDLSHIINLNKTTNVIQLIEGMNKYMNFISKKSAAWIGNNEIKSEVKEKGYPLSKNQYKMIANGVITDVPTTLSYNGKSETFTPKLHHYTKIVQESINDMINNDWDTDGGSAANVRMAKNKQKIIGGISPNMATYVSLMTMLVGYQSSGYLSIPKTAWTAYENELNSWTDFIWKIKNSNVYKSWIKGKTHKYWTPISTLIHFKAKSNYQFNQNNNFYDPSTITKNYPTKFKYTGTKINLDKQASAKTLFNKNGKKFTKPTKISNLEMQFAYMIQDLYGPNIINHK